jgi:hypothetical protein
MEIAGQGFIEQHPARSRDHVATSLERAACVTLPGGAQCDPALQRFLPAS